MINDIPMKQKYFAAKSKPWEKQPITNRKTSLLKVLVPDQFLIENQVRNWYK
jgi:hypothetical protein